MTWIEYKDLLDKLPDPNKFPISVYQLIDECKRGENGELYRVEFVKQRIADTFDRSKNYIWVLQTI